MKHNPTDHNVLPEDISEAMMEALTPVQPAASRAQHMRARILDKARKSKTAQEKGYLTIEKELGNWIDVTPLAQIKMLIENGNASSFLVRLQAGAEFPAHQHAADEECVMMEGELWIGDFHLKAGDYHFAPKGQPHGHVHTDTGALLFIRGPIPDGVEALL